MIIIGSLVLIAALIFGVDLVVQNHSHHIITSTVVFDQSLGVTNEAAVFIIGAITGGDPPGIGADGVGVRHRGSKAATHRMERKEAKGLGASGTSWCQTTSACGPILPRSGRPNLRLPTIIRARRRISNGPALMCVNSLAEALGTGVPAIVGTNLGFAPSIAIFHPHRWVIVR